MPTAEELRARIDGLMAEKPERFAKLNARIAEMEAQKAPEGMPTSVAPYVAAPQPWDAFRGAGHEDTQRGGSSTALKDVENELEAKLNDPDVIRAIVAGELKIAANKSGNISARCPHPSHKDGHPSFGINPDKGGAWTCSCDLGGNNVTGCVLWMRGLPQSDFHKVKEELALKYAGFDYAKAKDDAKRAVTPSVAMPAAAPALATPTGSGPVAPPVAPPTPVSEFIPGDVFILDTPVNAVPIWGEGEDVLMAEGEALIIAADQGLGKSTLGQQLALGRLGIPAFSQLLGYPITPGQKRVLYLAMDRPKQIARSFARMVSAADRTVLHERLLIMQGPPPADFAKSPETLYELCKRADADTVIVDSLKDAALGLSEDVVGAGYNRARQMAITYGVEVIELHHNRKAANVTTKEAASKGIQDVYGSVWIPNGSGSIILLNGNAGDAIVDFKHVKHPVSEVGPFKIEHDHTTGRTTTYNRFDLYLFADNANGVTVEDVAKAMFEKATPSKNDKQNARRKLSAAVSKGHLVISDPGDPAHGVPARYRKS